MKLSPKSNHSWPSRLSAALLIGSLLASLAGVSTGLLAQLPGPGDLPPNASSTGTPAKSKPVESKSDAPKKLPPVEIIKPSPDKPAQPAASPSSSVLPGPGDLPPNASATLPKPPKPEADTKPASEPGVTREEIAAAEGPKFIGAVGCSSSLCHGGGSPVHGRYSYTIWKSKDPHRQSYAVLSGPRSQRMAQALQLGDATQTTRCTECHAPLKSVPETRISAGLNAATEGVSCESCHGPAQNWIRSHTRLDLTHAQNAETGLRDLNNLYVRANNCVACHQVLSPDILLAGHPPLIFELDAQTVAEPRHWIDRGDFFGPQAWLVGQAAALRETSWALSQTAEPPEVMREQWRALIWLLQRTTEAAGSGLPRFDAPQAGDFSPGNVARAQSVADDLAKAASRQEWGRQNTRRCLDALAGTSKEFLPTMEGGTALTLRFRAQRLALALSRLVAPLQMQSPDGWKTASGELDKLFKVADATQAFDAALFSDQLGRFAKALPAIGEVASNR